MKLVLKQRLFSWFDNYDITDETGNTVYTVKGQLSWGHCLKIFDREGNELGMVQEKVMTFLPKFEIYMNNKLLGCIRKELTFLKPIYEIDFNGWHIEGDILEWEYSINNIFEQPVAEISKQLFHWSDTYTIDVRNPEDALASLMVVLAIDAEKCTRG
ncbi:MAG: LURP-one-related/scramblase family protein [Agathobacter sp.]